MLELTPLPWSRCQDLPQAMAGRHVFQGEIDVGEGQAMGDEPVDRKTAALVQLNESGD